MTAPPRPSAHQLSIASSGGARRRRQSSAQSAAEDIKCANENVLAKNIFRLATTWLDREGIAHWSNNSVFSAYPAYDGDALTTTTSTIVFRLASTDHWFMTPVVLIILIVALVALIGFILTLIACCCYFRMKKDRCSYELATALRIGPNYDDRQVPQEFYV